jgi:hypothetical protein
MHNKAFFFLRRSAIFHTKGRNNFSWCLLRRLKSRVHFPYDLRFDMRFDLRFVACVGVLRTRARHFLALARQRRHRIAGHNASVHDPLLGPKMRENHPTVDGVLVLWVITHPSTIQAQHCLTLVIKWVPVRILAVTTNCSWHIHLYILSFLSSFIQNVRFDDRDVNAWQIDHIQSAIIRVTKQMPLRINKRRHPSFDGNARETYVRRPDVLYAY